MYVCKRKWYCLCCNWQNRKFHLCESRIKVFTFCYFIYVCLCFLFACVIHNILSSIKNPFWTCNYFNMHTDHWIFKCFIIKNQGLLFQLLLKCLPNTVPEVLIWNKWILSSSSISWQISLFYICLPEIYAVSIYWSLWKQISLHKNMTLCLLFWKWKTPMFGKIQSWVGSFFNAIFFCNSKKSTMSLIMEAGHDWVFLSLFVRKCYNQVSGRKVV